MKGVILFDGVCRFCNSSVQFVIKHDTEAYFKFASLQSKTGREFLRKYGIDDEIDSFVLILGDSYYTHSDAVLMVCKFLDHPWKWLYVMRFIPRPIRNMIYNIIAKNRYKWFGKETSCIVPSRDIRERFLDYN